MISLTISHYRIREKIGRGMGVVDKAVDSDPDCFVASKFLPASNYRCESKYDS